MTVVFIYSRNFSVFASCFFSTLMKASLKMRDCSSMYCSERVLLASRYCRRLWIDLKNDSWVEGAATFGCVGEGRELVGLDGLATTGSLWVFAGAVLAGGGTASVPGGRVDDSL